jgi:hypothetical protein
MMKPILTLGDSVVDVASLSIEDKSTVANTTASAQRSIDTLLETLRTIAAEQRVPEIGELVWLTDMRNQAEGGEFVIEAFRDQPTLEAAKQHLRERLSLQDSRFYDTRYFTHIRGALMLLDLDSIFA